LNWKKFNIHFFSFYFLFAEKESKQRKAAPKANLLYLLSHNPALLGPKYSGFAPFGDLPRASEELNSV
jgi:hypothetical protein